jgi:hypothetical protein
VIVKAGGQIFELSQQKDLDKIASRITHIQAVIETRNEQHAYDIQQALLTGGFTTQMLDE